MSLDSFDALTEAADGWNLDFLQLDRGSFNAEFNQILSPAAILIETEFSRRIEQRGAPPSGYRTFGFSARANIDLEWRGKDVGSEDLLLFPPGSSYSCISNPGFHIFAFSVAGWILDSVASRRGVDDAAKLFPCTDVLTCPKRNLDIVRKLASRLSRSAADRPKLVNFRSFRESLEVDLVEAIFDAIEAGEGVSDFNPEARTRSRALKKALDVIADRADEPVSVAEIAQLSGVTDRTLRYAFEDAYDLSPKQYLQSYRLNQVHRLLRRALEEGQNVSDAANAWGFWHMGQFASDYRKMFGRLPGETLQRR